MFLVAAVAVTLLAGTAGAGSSHVRIERIHRHVVVQGETVWSIAKSIARDQDPRPTVDEIIHLNHIDDAAIFPGDVLQIPASATA